MSAPPICMAPFGALSIAADGRVRPCCQYVGEVGHLRNGTLKSVWEGEGLAALRAQMRAGDRPEACWKCWQAEAAGDRSLRNQLNARFAAITQDSPAQKPVYLDFRYSNLCNFRCRTCHHGASSRWFSDAKAMGSTAGDTALLSAFDSAEDGIAQFREIDGAIKSLYFAGGEPLMEKQNLVLLEMLIAEGRTDVVLCYNTNLSVLDIEKVDITRLWKQFPRLNIETSIDAIGEEGALIRRGFDWEVYKANIARLRAACPHALISAGITVSALNIMRLPELFRALHDDCGLGWDAMHVHALQMPRHYDVTILPDAAKERAAIRLEALAREIESDDEPGRAPKALRQLIRRMQPESIGASADDLAQARADFLRVTRQLDELRKEDTTTTLPELAPLLTNRRD